MTSFYTILHAGLILTIIISNSNAAFKPDTSTDILTKGKIDTLSLQIKPKNQIRYGFLVGNNKADGYQKLRYVKNDLRDLKNTLVKFCRFKDKNIKLLYNKEPQDFYKVLDSMVQYVHDKNTFFLFYYSGHADQDNLLMGKAKFPFKELNQYFKKLSFRIGIFIFDACHSGNFRMKGSGGKINIAPSFLHHTSSNIKGKAVLYSSTANEFSHEYEKFQNSVFTYHFINALKGFGDFSEDHEVSLDEAYKYAYDQTVISVDSLLQGKQTPGRQIDIQGEGDIILSNTDKCSTGIQFDNEITGAISIIDRTKSVVAQLFKEKKNKLIYPLKPGTYQIRHTRSQQVRQAKARIKGDKIVYIQTDNFLKKSGFPFSLNVKSTVLRTGLFQDKKTMAMVGLGIEIALPKNMQLVSQVFYAKFKDDLPFRKLTIPSILFNNGLGYKMTGLKRFNKRLLRFLSNFSLQAGIDILYMDYTMYEKHSSGKIRAKGNLYFPFIACDYTYPIFHFLSFGPTALFRHSIPNQELERPILPINVKMFEFGFFVKFHPAF